MSSANFAYFQIAAKAIIKNGGNILLLIKSDGSYDFPGGRMNETEVDLSLHEVLTRELREELGENFKFTIGDVAFVSKRRYARDNKDHRILATFFEVKYEGGDVQLSNEHTKYEWIQPQSILANPEKFISEDEYAQYAQYCKPRA